MFYIKIDRCLRKWYQFTLYYYRVGYLLYVYVTTRAITLYLCSRSYVCKCREYTNTPVVTNDFSYFNQHCADWMWWTKVWFYYILKLKCINQVIKFIFLHIVKYYSHKLYEYSHSIFLNICTSMVVSLITKCHWPMFLVCWSIRQRRCTEMCLFIEDVRVEWLKALFIYLLFLK